MFLTKDNNHDSDNLGVKRPTVPFRMKGIGIATNNQLNSCAVGWLTSTRHSFKRSGNFARSLRRGKL